MATLTLEFGVHPGSVGERLIKKLELDKEILADLDAGDENKQTAG